MAGFVFALVVTLILPLVLFFLVARRLRTSRPILLGAACFVIFQVLTRIPLLQLVLPRFPQYLLFQFTRPVLFIWFLSFTAGLFEEAGRYVIMRRFMKGAPLAHAAAFGLGHGGIEAILLVGVSFAVLGFTGRIGQIPQEQFFWGALERVFAVVFHICLSILVWRSLKDQKPLLLGAAILLHTLLNVMATWLSLNQAPLYLVEGAVGLSVLLFLLYTIRSVRPLQREGVP